MCKDTERTMLATALTLGVVAGLRSQLPLALLGWRIRQQSSSHEAASLPAIFHNPLFAPVVTTLAGAELIGDKLPFTPSRLNRGSLAGRLLLGGLAGAITAKASRQSLALGTLAGASGAIGGTFGGYHARKAVVQLSGIPDPIVALAEDAIAVGLGVWAANRLPLNDAVKNSAHDS
jgi:uncharacterized membrane protein